MPVMFNETDLKQQQRVKCAFDPGSLMNPGKVFPQLHRCAELGRMHVHHGKVAASRPAAVLMMAHVDHTRAEGCARYLRGGRGCRGRRATSWRSSAAAASAELACRSATRCMLSMAGIARVIDYDPAELVLTVEPGARLAEIETLLGEEKPDAGVRAL